MLQADMITEMAIGMDVDEAYYITRNDVADELDGLPPIKLHCSNLAADALQAAIENYREKKKKVNYNIIHPLIFFNRYELIYLKKKVY